MITDPTQLGTILGVWAHPDDEAYTMSGIMAAAARNGQRVVCVTATLGEKGSQDEKKWPLKKLGAIRYHEILAAMRVMGVKECHFLGYHDGDMAKADDEAAITKIADIIAEVKPDSVLTFGPEGLTGHSDHQTACRWATEALRQLKSPAKLYYATLLPDWQEHFGKLAEDYNFFFAIDEPPTTPREKLGICYDLPADIQAIKLQALKSHTSQTEAMINDVGEEAYLRPHITECFRLANILNSELPTE